MLLRYQQTSMPSVGEFVTDHGCIYIDELHMLNSFHLLIPEAQGLCKIYIRNDFMNIELFLAVKN